MTKSIMQTAGEDIAVKLLAAGTFGQTFTAGYKRLYISDLLAELPAATDVLDVAVVPITPAFSRVGAGTVHAEFSMGLVVQKQVADPDDATELDPLEKFVEDICLFMVGKRYFGDKVTCTSAKPIYGDHLNDHLKGKSEFHVPIPITMLAAF